MYVREKREENTAQNYFILFFQLCGNKIWGNSTYQVFYQIFFFNMSLAQTNQTDVQALGSQTPTLANRNGKGKNSFRKQK